MNELINLKKKKNSNQTSQMLESPIFPEIHDCWKHLEDLIKTLFTE